MRRFIPTRVRVESDRLTAFVEPVRGWGFDASDSFSVFKKENKRFPRHTPQPVSLVARPVKMTSASRVPSLPRRLEPTAVMSKHRISVGAGIAMTARALAAHYTPPVTALPLGRTPA